MTIFLVTKGNVVLKLNRLGSFIFTFFLVVIVILYILFNIKPNNTGLNSNHSDSYPTELNPLVKERSDQLVQQAAKKGIVIMITDGFRSVEAQDQLYEKGRTSDGNIVTNAKGGESYHNYGLAIDFALKTPSGNVIWDRQYDGNKNGIADWTEVVQIAKTLGFQWGGDWAQFKDYPHLQMDFGLTLAELQNGKRPAGSSLTADSKQ
jgi:peptidoglycan L-alanyl-D-glutamate endopeptidase CwlK